MKQSTAKANSIESQLGMTHFTHIVSCIKEISKGIIKSKLFVNNFPYNIIYPFKPFLNYFIFYFSIKIPQKQFNHL